MEFFRYDFMVNLAPNSGAMVGVIEGALIKSGGGYGCLQPWPKLGDEPLEAQLEALRAGAPTELGEACLLCCEIDGEARREGRSLFDDLSIPASHLFVDEIDEYSLRRAGEVGLVKVKSAELVAPLAEVAEVRIDFNHSLDVFGFRDFVRELDDRVRERIDFVEDPLPYDAQLWQELAEESGLRFALDRGPADAQRGVSVRVWKPACVPHPPVGEKFCITHNMDHELGRRYAAYRAATFEGQLVACGLGQGNYSGGTGLGMDEKLAALPWREL